MAESDYTPTGTLLELPKALPAYVAGKPGPRAVIVFPEVYGFNGRLKGICDTLAEQGFFVVMPDIMRGKSAESLTDFGTQFGPFINQFPWATVVQPDVQSIMSWLSEQGASSVGAIGFCWGVWVLLKASAEGVPLKCGVGPHPSSKLEGMLGGSEIGMMGKVQMPTLLMPAGNDPDNIKPGGECQLLLAAQGGECHVYPEMSHGWASRGDVKETTVARIPSPT